MLLEKRQRSPLTPDFYPGKLFVKSGVNSDRKQQPSAQRANDIELISSPLIDLINSKPKGSHP
ncbi:hypothetical protein [Paenibacillus solani]|uniref:Uncharacterized protein n=1 Tax=Paenibacillus solani TaxID=1705565 RepID=A0A0M1P2R8_9BACL|nr:hypothetical protein [Paenibacillus solani]KOR88697.1 hypothetical protein AM231_05650 [Paenibacillus solani]